jgi:hypothetical protein
MRYVLLIYFDPRKVFDGSLESNRMLDEIEPYDELLRERGHFILGQPLSLPNEAVTVQVRDGETSTTDGPFVETKEMLAGFVLVEARDLNEAIQIAAHDPFARAGFIEVRPAIDPRKPRPVV